MYSIYLRQGSSIPVVILSLIFSGKEMDGCVGMWPYVSHVKLNVCVTVRSAGLVTLQPTPSIQVHRDSVSTATLLVT